MEITNLWSKLRSQLQAQWLVCKAISDKKSIQYGIRFSYPIYMAIVVLGTLLANPYILSTAALIAFLGMKLPMHPFDYVYNHGVARLIGTNKIPGRGSELQVNSIVALAFNLCVLALIFFSIPINFVVLAILYVLSSIFFLWVKSF